MKKRKWLALGLATCMTMSVLSGCGQSETKKEESSASKEEISSVQESKSEEASSEEVVEDTGITFPLEDPVNFTGFVNIHSGDVKLTDSAAWKEFLNYGGNITVDWIQAPANEAQEKANILLSTDDYPDFYYRVVPDPAQYGVEEGIYIPLEELIREYMPNLTALLDEHNGWKALESADGHIYSIGEVSCKTAHNGYYPWINKRWLENVGMDMPTNMEELYEVSKAFKEQDANGNGDPNDEIVTTLALNGYDIYYSLYYMDEGTMSINDRCYIKDGVKSFYPFTEDFKENYLRWWKRMWDEDLLDHNAFTQTIDQMRAVTWSDDVIGWFWAHNPSRVAKEDYQCEYFIMEPVSKEYPISTNTPVRGGGLAITDKCENPEILLAWFDYFYSVDGGYLAYYGPEGVTHTRNEDGSIVIINEDWAKECTNGGVAAVWREPASVAIYNEDSDPYLAHYNTERYKISDNYGFAYPPVIYTSEENDVIVKYAADIIAYVDTYTAEVITGIKDLDATWDEFQATLKAMGAEELEAAYQAAFARAME